ncbi:MAG: YjjG family noncanonical pyrimidine nucleotidase [Clostridia bacterium]|nr:YjjG family noncanonical pyrimidine nucleotidase [Clostridia bacterium]
MKRFLLIDLDDTILDFSKSENTAVKLALNELGLYSNDEVASWYKRFNIEVWKDFEKGLITRENLGKLRFVRLLEKMGEDISLGDKLNNTYCSLLAYQHFMIDGAREFLVKIAAYYRIIGVSNGTSKVQWQRIKDSGLNELTESIFVSEDIGIQKPKKEYFEYVAAHVDGFEKEQAVIVGDSLTSDISGGKNYGITTVWYNPENESSNLPDYVVKNFDELYDLLISLNS